METITEPTAETSCVIDVAPARLWDIVADVTRIPEWSPVCHAVEWTDGSTAAVVGARFRGHNRLNGARWARDCVLTEAAPGSVLSFSTLFKGEESTRWRYRLEPVGSSTRVSESYQVVMMPRWVRGLRRLPGATAKSERDTAVNITTSLERLTAIAASV